MGKIIKCLLWPKSYSDKELEIVLTIVENNLGISNKTLQTASVDDIKKMQVLIENVENMKKTLLALAIDLYLIDAKDISLFHFNLWSKKRYW